MTPVQAAVSRDSTEDGINTGVPPQILFISCTPPPAYHTINLPPGNPANLINTRGAPPSYEEVIDRNGNFN